MRSIKDTNLLRWIKYSIQNSLYSAYGGKTHPACLPGQPIPFSPHGSSPTYMNSGYSMTPSPMVPAWNNSGCTTGSVSHRLVN